MAVRALGRRAASSCAIEDLDAGRVRARLRRSEQLADLAAIGLDWDGDRSCASPSASTATRRRSSRSTRDGRVYPCFCTRAEIREAASAPHGPLPEGAYPGTCRA